MSPRTSSTAPSPLRTLGAALAVTVLGVGVASLLLDGFASAPLLRLLQGICLFGLGTALVIATVSLVVIRLGGWRDPDAEFDALVERSEFLARSGADLDRQADNSDFAADEYQDLEVAAEDATFDALVRAAVEELPLEFHRALEHVAVVVSDGGSGVRTGRGRRGAYGLYQGDTIVQNHFHERIVIFRDTLLRDFGHDPEMLREQVRRTVRHELAHHLGWDERGVSDLGL
jgi:predicted Zn-dependent protease with MMP-like domain